MLVREALDIYAPSESRAAHETEGKPAMMTRCRPEKQMSREQIQKGLTVVERCTNTACGHLREFFLTDPLS